MNSESIDEKKINLFINLEFNTETSKFEPNII